MSIPSLLLRAATVSALLALPRPALAQCVPHWGSTFNAPPGAGANDDVYCLLAFDDGSGPSLFAGGSFTALTGGVSAKRVARWDGTTWHTLGTGTNSDVLALCAFDEGSGPRLFACGAFGTAGGAPASRIARWDGSSWSALGAGLGGGTAQALAVYDDGSGPRLYAGGGFSSAGGATANHIASWNGATWAPLLQTQPGGSVINGLSGIVDALCVYDDGNGPKLYAGGAFGLQRWNGTAWEGLPVGGPVHALTIDDDGSGPSLVVGGELTFAGVAVNNIARLQGTVWSALGSGVGGAFSASVRGLCGFDDGSGPALYAAGNFTTAGGLPARNIARWRNGSWSALGDGLDNQAWALARYPSSGPAALVVGGIFQIAGGAPAKSVARWDGSAFSLVGAGSPLAGLNNIALASLVFDDGNGPALFVGGSFTAAGQLAVGGIARWSGTAWSAIGGSGPVLPVSINSMTVHDDGSGTRLFASGSFVNGSAPSEQRVARWDGATWTLLPGQALARGLLSFDDGSGRALYACGSFTSINGVAANCVARWDGTNWNALGSGLDFQANALAVFDAGSGPVLVAAGYFTHAGGVPAAYVAQWNGTAWSELGSGGQPTESLLVADLGSGPALFAGVSAGVLRLTGSNWSQLGAAFPNALVFALDLFDDGSGARLVAAGNASNGSSDWGVRSWDGSAWTALGGNLAFGIAHTLSVFDGLPGGSPDLYVGGVFPSAGGAPASNLAVWEGCLANVSSFCAGDGTLVPCPCANNGASGRGCNNSAATGGARLDAHGTTNPDTLQLSAANELPSALSIFLQGGSQIAPVSFGDGLRCAGSPLVRLYAKSASSGAVTAPGAGDLPITTRSAQLGDTIAPGSTRSYQTYYRDANPGFCPAPQGNTFNVSNGVRVVW